MRLGRCCTVARELMPSPRSRIKARFPFPRFLKGCVLALSTFACADAALSEDICPGKLFDYRQDDAGLVFWLKEVPNVVFRTSAECDPSGECIYEITSNDLGGTRMIAERLRFSNICNAFKRSQKEKANPYFESGDAILFAFTRTREIQYLYTEDILQFRIVVSQYYDKPRDDPWGRWEGDEYSGKMLSLGVETVKVLIGSAN